MSQKYKLWYYLRRVYVGGFSHRSEQKLQTGLLKMHFNSLPVWGAFVSPKYSGSPGNGCKQSSAQLINYTLSKGTNNCGHCVLDKHIYFLMSFSPTFTFFFFTSIKGFFFLMKHQMDKKCRLHFTASFDHIYQGYEYFWAQLYLLFLCFDNCFVSNLDYCCSRYICSALVFLDNRLLLINKVLEIVQHHQDA